MAPKIEDDDSDDELPLSSRVKKETSTPKGERPPGARGGVRGGFFIFSVTHRRGRERARRGNFQKLFFLAGGNSQQSPPAACESDLFENNIPPPAHSREP